MKQLQIALACAVIAWSTTGKTDRMGNGGYVPENHFISIGYDWLNALTKAEPMGALPGEVKPGKLAEVLRVTHVKFKHGVMLGGEPKSAVNYPSMNLITPDFDDWDAASLESKYQLVIHEFLPLMGVDDHLSKVSIPLMSKIQALGLLSMNKSSTDAPVLLFSAEYDSQKQGLDQETANKLCRYYKELNQQKYYFVYCVVLEKIWFREELFEQQTYKAYGLRVFGLGLESNLQFKVLASSLNLGGGLISREFSTEREAYRACRARVAESNDQSLLYHQATCRAPLNPFTQKFYYEIVTKNPLVEQ